MTAGKRKNPAGTVVGTEAYIILLGMDLSAKREEDGDPYIPFSPPKKAPFTELG